MPPDPYFDRARYSDAHLLTYTLVWVVVAVLAFVAGRDGWV